MLQGHYVHAADGITHAGITYKLHSAQLTAHVGANSIGVRGFEEENSRTQAKLESLHTGLPYVAGRVCRLPKQSGRFATSVARCTTRIKDVGPSETGVLLQPQGRFFWRVAAFNGYSRQHVEA